METVIELILIFVAGIAFGMIVVFALMILAGIFDSIIDVIRRKNH